MVVHVDVGATEIGEFGHHRAEALLAQRERDVAGDSLRHDERMHRWSAGLGNRQRDGGIVEDDHERLGVEVTEDLTDRQHRVQGSSVTDVVAVAVEDQDASTRRQPDQAEIRHASRVARAEHEPVPERVRDLCTHLVADLGGISIRHHDDGDPFAGVGPQQLIHHHGEQARRTEHHDVVGLDDRAAATLHAVDLRFDSARDDTDERAEHQQAENGDHQRDDPLTRTGVAGHRAGVERAQQALPEVLEPRRVLASGEGDAAAAEQERRDQHDGERDDPEPQQHRPGAAREQAIEAVSQVLAPGCSVARTAASAHAAPSSVQITRTGR